jgi:hypothetical protein
VLLAAAALGLLRCVLADGRPRFGGSESSDLERAMLYHYGVRGYRDWTWLEQIGRDGFKPPLWFGGVPLLFAGRPAMTTADFGMLNLVATLATAALLWRSAGPWAAAALLALPGIAGRVTFAGTEHTQMALLLGLLLALREMRAPLRGRLLAARALGVGLLLGTCLLVKWTFATPAGILFVFEMLRGPDGTGRRPAHGAALLGAAGLGGALLLAWLLPFSDLDVILRQAGEEPSFPDRFSSQALGYFPRDLVRHALGPAGTGLAAAGAALLLARRGGEESSPLLPPLLCVTGALLAFHTALPHKEWRYLLPAYPALALLVALPLQRLARDPRTAARAAAWLLLLVLFGLSYGQPALQAIATTEPAAAKGSRPPYELRPSYPAPDRDDFGLDAILRHASFAERPLSYVTYSLGGTPVFPSLGMLEWELYSRNPRPVVSRGQHTSVLDRACAYDLVRSTHFLTNRGLDAQELAALRSLGFEESARSRPRIKELGELALWARDPGEAPLPSRPPSPAPAPAP